MFDYYNSARASITKDITVDVIDSLKSRFIAVDTETTGMSADYDSLLEIGAAVFENGKIIDNFNTLINPQTYIPQYITDINHITNSMVENAPKEKVAIKMFLDFLSKYITKNTYLVAHNANFDMKFLLLAIDRNNYDCDLHFVDTLKISRKFYPNLCMHNLEYLQTYFNVVNPNQHRATDDAISCGEILLKMLKKVEIEIEANKNMVKSRIPQDQFITTFAYIEKILFENNIDLELLSCIMKDRNIMEISNGVPFLGVDKLKGNYRYYKGLILNADLAEIKSDIDLKELYNIIDFDSSKYYFIGLPQYSDIKKYSTYIVNSFNNSLKILSSYSDVDKNEHIKKLDKYKKIDSNNLDMYLSDGARFKHYY